MTTAEKSFLISIRQCDKAQLLRLQYAVYTAGWENKLTYALLGTIGDTNNGPFRLNGVVKLQEPSTITKVTALLYLYGDFAVVPTNADFSSYNISRYFDGYLAYGSLDGSSVKSDNTDDLSINFFNGANDSLSGDEELVEPPIFEVIGGPNEQDDEIIQIEVLDELIEVNEQPEDEAVQNIGDDAAVAGDDSDGILSVQTYYNEDDEMENFNELYRFASEADKESFWRTKRFLERKAGAIETLPEDSFCFVCRNTIVRRHHRVQLGLECPFPNCCKAQLYHLPCLYTYMFNTHDLPKCDYCRKPGRR